MAARAKSASAILPTRSGQHDKGVISRSVLDDPYHPANTRDPTKLRNDTPTYALLSGGKMRMWDGGRSIEEVILKRKLLGERTASNRGSPCPPYRPSFKNPNEETVPSYYSEFVPPSQTKKAVQSSPERIGKRASVASIGSLKSDGAGSVTNLFQKASKKVSRITELSKPKRQKSMTVQTKKELDGLAKRQRDIQELGNTTSLDSPLKSVTRRDDNDDLGLEKMIDFDANEDTGADNTIPSSIPEDPHHLSLRDLKMKTDTTFDGIWFEGEADYDAKLQRLRRKFVKEEDRVKETKRERWMDATEPTDIDPEATLGHLDVLAERISSQKDVGRQNDLKRHFQTINLNLMYLQRQLQVGGSKDQVIFDAARVIQSGWRAYVRRTQYKKVKKSLDFFREKNTTAFFKFSYLWCRQRKWFDELIRRFNRQHELTEMQPSYLRWSTISLRNAPIRRHLEIVRKEKLKAKLQIIMERWNQVAMGPQNRFILTERYEKRVQQAKENLLDWQEKSQWKGVITDGMIKDEYDKICCDYMFNLLARRKWSVNWDKWVAHMRRKVKEREAIMKGRIHFRKILRRKVLNALRQYMNEQRRKGGKQYVSRRNKRVEDRRQRYMLLSKIFDAWGPYATSRQKAMKMRKKRDSEVIVNVFKAFVEQIKRDRKLRMVALARWMEYSRNIRLVPFRAWYLYYLHIKQEKSVQITLLQATARRKNRRLLHRIFLAWKEVAELGDRMEYQRTKAELIEALDRQFEVAKALETSIKQQTSHIDELEKALKDEQENADMKEQELATHAQELMAMKKAHNDNYQELLEMQQTIKQQEDMIRDLERKEKASEVPFDAQDVSTWKRFHVTTWLAQQGVAQIVVDIFANANITGKELLIMSRHRLEQLSLSGEEQQDKFMNALQDLKENMEDHIYKDISPEQRQVMRQARQDEEIEKKKKDLELNSKLVELEEVNEELARKVAVVEEELAEKKEAIENLRGTVKALEEKADEAQVVIKEVPVPGLVPTDADGVDPAAAGAAAEGDNAGVGADEDVMEHKEVGEDTPAPERKERVSSGSAKPVSAEEKPVGETEDDRNSIGQEKSEQGSRPSSGKVRVVTPEEEMQVRPNGGDSAKSGHPQCQDTKGSDSRPSSGKATSEGAPSRLPPLDGAPQAPAAVIDGGRSVSGGVARTSPDGPTEAAVPQARPPPSFDEAPLPSVLSVADPEAMSGGLKEFHPKSNVRTSAEFYVHNPTGVSISRADARYMQRSKWLLSKFPEKYQGMEKYYPPATLDAAQNECRELMQMLEALRDGSFNGKDVSKLAPKKVPNEVPKEVTKEMKPSLNLEPDLELPEDVTEEDVLLAGQKLRWGDVAQSLTVYERKQKARNKLAQRIQEQKKRTYVNARKPEKFNIYGRPSTAPGGGRSDTAEEDDDRAMSENNDVEIEEVSVLSPHMKVAKNLPDIGGPDITLPFVTQ